MNYGSMNRNILLILFTLLFIFTLSFFERTLSIQANVALPDEGKYKINAGQSKFTVKAFAGGLLSALAHDHLIDIQDFSGDVRFTYGTVEPASMELTIKAASLTLLDKVSDSDRQKIENTMRSEVLEVDKHPEITFKSTSVSAQRVDEGRYQTKITGDLTLHGVTRNITLNATIEFAHSSLRAQGQFTIRQSDFSIKPVSIGAGTIKVKNELKFNFDIVASR
jgi:polyisoprenoid-binding protein YceI